MGAPRPVLAFIAVAVLFCACRVDATRVADSDWIEPALIESKASQTPIVSGSTPAASASSAAKPASSTSSAASSASSQGQSSTDPMLANYPTYEWPKTAFTRQLQYYQQNSLPKKLKVHLYAQRATHPDLYNFPLQGRPEVGPDPPSDGFAPAVPRYDYAPKFPINMRPPTHPWYTPYRFPLTSSFPNQYVTNNAVTPSQVMRAPVVATWNGFSPQNAGGTAPLGLSGFASNIPATGPMGGLQGSLMAAGLLGAPIGLPPVGTNTQSSFIPEAVHDAPSTQID